MIVTTWPWLALILLGAWHGLNPGMGWLFSVALGLQQRSRRAVFVALVPIALGHTLAIGLVVLLVYIVGTVIPWRWLQFGGAAELLAWIVYDFVGLVVLRRSWINLDLIWCFSLLGAAIVLVFAPCA